MEDEEERRITRRRSSEEEPEAEEEERKEDTTRGTEAIRSRVDDPQEFQRRYDESVAMSRRVDGLPETGPLKIRRTGRETSAPYHLEFMMTADKEEEEEDPEEQEQEKDLYRKQAIRNMMKESPKRDYWELDERARTLTRHHVQKRKTKFNPAKSNRLPILINKVGKERHTFLMKEGREEEKDEWVAEGSKKTPTPRWWKGKTVFYIREAQSKKDERKMEIWATEKEEVRLNEEDEDSRQKWKVSDASEWQKICDSGAVKLLTVEESRQVKERLRQEGKLNRILPSRTLRKYKLSDLPGEPPTRKSRLCIRGDQDPDALELERFSPTVNTMNLNVMLQLAVNLKMEIEVGDCKNAFCQSQPLQRKNGPLYFKQPREGIDGMHEEQIVQIIAGCYGLVDAPLHWRRSLVQTLKKLGYQESRLDPCIYKLYDQGRLTGILAIEVDDILSCGKGEHLKKMEELRSAYCFGKWVNLKEEKDGTAFNGRRLKREKDGTLHIDMRKFVSERLQEVKLEKGRKSQRKDEATEQERGQARATCGSLNWLSKEGRPDAAGPSSIMSSRLTRLTVEDIVDLNEVVKKLKETPEMAIKIQPLTNMQLAVVTDASFGNNGHHSQGGQMIVAHEPGLKEGRKVKANLVWWRSARLQRVVNSTLAAETQSLSKGLGDLLWMKVLLRELQEEKFNIREWPADMKHEEITAIASDQTSHSLQECLAIVDAAKSLYDYLAKETVGGQDKRTAIEVQIIREEMKQLNGSLRWVDHPAMIADTLTKVKGATKALFEMLRSGEFCITAEADHLAQRRECRDKGISSSELRRGLKVKEILGSCGNECLESCAD